MHIKTLRIQGFKSYRDQTAVEEFSPGHNVVVGRNGSGKSNFFAAIQFVLSDAYNSMSKEERSALLHESSTSTSTTLSAFVEIVFDNSDGRFPQNNPGDLVLRRTIGQKKDDYTLDRKMISKKEVLDLLEAAGFSRSNPYYIVPQGRITHLTNMKDSDRLKLLKDVAGTNIYEARRAESVQVMKETEYKKEQIEERLEKINDQLSELEERRQELKIYNEKDREKKALEYAMNYKDQVEAQGKLEDLTAKKNRENEKINELTTAFNNGDRELETLEKRIADLQEKEATHKAVMDSLIEERQDLSRLRANLESGINDQEERAERSGESRVALEARAAALETQINDVEGELMGLRPQLEDKAKELAQVRAELDDTKAKVDVLFAKQARSNQFSSKAQRDAALRKELESLQAFQTDQEGIRDEIELEMPQVGEKLSSIESSMAEKRELLDNGKQTMLEGAQRWDALESESATLQEKRKALWKQEQTLATTSAASKERLASARKTLATTMDRATAKGLESVEAIAERMQLQGVYGPLYKLFTVKDMYKRAVDVTAGQSLFHVVVDTDETASRMLEVMNREKGGRVTFVPLNRIKPKTMQFADKNDATLMLKVLQYDAKFAVVMQQVFARTVICETLAVASSYAKSHDVNAITLHGDRIERKGVLTGGSEDSRKNRLDAVEEVNGCQEAYDRQSSELKEKRQLTAELDQRITELASERQKLHSHGKQQMAARRILSEELDMLRGEQAANQARMARLQLRLDECNRDLAQITFKRSALEEEIRTPLQRGLRSAEEAELKTLTSRGDTQEKLVADMNRMVNEMNNKKQMLEIDLNDRLNRERTRITLLLDSLQEESTSSQGLAEVGASTGQTVAASKKRLGNVTRQFNERQKELDREAKAAEGLQKDMQKAQDELDAATSAQAKVAREMQRQDKVMDVLAAKIKEQAKKRDDSMRKIRELGAVPFDSANKYLDTPAEVLLKKVHKINQTLKKHSNMNRHAVDQYDQFTKDRDRLLAGQESLERSSTSIQELIESLDMKKDEAVERTFKQVSKNFAEVFEKLVPMGRGQLVMQRRVDETEDQEAMDLDDEEDEGKSAKKSGSSIDYYTGVSIKVSFHSKVDEGLRIQQLSGGQKSLVALAIVFAIQKCDPAAFYLFDEIDANLDAQYRTAVASMIHDMSETAQFITTTFRPELVGVAERHYGVVLSAQKVSTLNLITQDDAYQFVEASQQVS